MYQSQLKLCVSSFVVISHGAIFFVALAFQSHQAFDNEDAFSVLGALIPLFGLFVTIIIKDTLANKFNMRKGRKVNSQMLVVTLFICLFYLGGCFTTFYLFYNQTITTSSDLSNWIARIEAAFGIGLGLIIDDLFGGQT